MGLWIENSGTSTREIERGIAAAQQYLQEKGYQPQACYQAVLQQANAATPSTNEDVQAMVNAWDESERIARAACFEGWVRVPESAVLVWE